MIRINLLPVRVSRRQEAVRQELLLGALGAVALILVCGVLYLFQTAAANELKAVNASLQTDLDNLNAIVARVDEVEKINEDLRKKLSVIEGLQASKVGPVHMLDELSSATPEKLHLTSLIEKDGRILLKGIAASNEVISQFLINLERSTWFDEVYLNGIDQESVGGYSLKKFDVSARMVEERQREQARKNMRASARAAATEEPATGNAE